MLRSLKKIQIRVNCIVAQCSEPYSPCFCVHWPFFSFEEIGVFQPCVCGEYISMEEQGRTRGPHFLFVFHPKVSNFVFSFFASSVACTLSGVE